MRRTRSITLLSALALAAGLLVPAAPAAAEEIPGYGAAAAAIDRVETITGTVPTDAATIAVQGTLSVVAVEPRDGGDAAPIVSVLYEGGSVRISGALPDDIVSGARFDGTLVADATTRSRSTLPVEAGSEASGAEADALLTASDDDALPVAAATVRWSTGAAAAATAHTVDVAVTAPPGSGLGYYPDAQVKALIARLDVYYRDQTAGQIASITVPRTILRYVSSAAAPCDGPELWSEARTRFGTSESDYLDGSGRHLLVLSPASCRELNPEYGGLGNIGSSLGDGGQMWVEDWSETDDSVTAHEFGHNVGFNHAGRRACTNSGGFPDCTPNEYGDLYDIMGGARSGPHELTTFNATRRIDYGLLPTSSITALALGPGQGARTWTMKLRAASEPSGVRVVSVTDPFDGSRYDVEYRAGTGTDDGAIYDQMENTDFQRGVRLLSSYRLRSTLLTPVAAWNADDGQEQAAVAGESITAPSGRVVVQVDALDGTNADLTIRITDVPALVSSGAGISAAYGRAPGNRLDAFTFWNVPGARLSYQWYDDGVAIRGATEPSYTPSTDQYGHRISYHVEATKPGFKPAGADSRWPSYVSDEYNTFEDVTPDSEFFDDIQWVAGEQIARGYSTRAGLEYRPVEKVSRQAMAAFLYRDQGEPAFTPPARPSFVDVPLTHPFYREIEWMRAEGITTGVVNPDGTRSYLPNDPVSRQATAAFLSRIDGGSTYTPATPTFSDVPKSNPFWSQIEWMAAEGITTGYPDGTFRPLDAVTRQSMAAFLHRYDGVS
ncbi:S-layer homology domain-containing protein [Microbacteriaceae bacterium VKM Ac-2855]|nr:S-layer homology domain-containing protein [Microbacteriaceae bacterium VKM Ac-2855]